MQRLSVCMSTAGCFSSDAALIFVAVAVAIVLTLTKAVRVLQLGPQPTRTLARSAWYVLLRREEPYTHGNEQMEYE